MADPSNAGEVERLSYQPGDVVARKYELEALLGEGGTGEVYRARNVAIDMPVAIKLLHADMNKATFRRRLLEEARAVAKLQHPAIMRVFDVGRTALGDQFIVMELLEGESLADRLDREGPMEPAAAVSMMLPIAEALAVAHARGFVHRDVKPDNIFIHQSNGQVQPKLVDFGIVKPAELGVRTRLTKIGILLGSPDYMSPEQAQGLDVLDHRTDIWSFAVVLHELIAGEAPFSSPNYNALLRMIVEQAPPSLVRLGVADEELTALIARGMAKKPAGRFSSMMEFGRALAQWLSAQGQVVDVCGVGIENKWLAGSDNAARFAAESAAQPDREFIRASAASVAPVSTNTTFSSRALGTAGGVTVTVGLLIALAFASAAAMGLSRRGDPASSSSPAARHLEEGMPHSAAAAAPPSILLAPMPAGAISAAPAAIDATRRLAAPARSTATPAPSSSAKPEQDPELTPEEANPAASVNGAGNTDLLPAY